MLNVIRKIVGLITLIGFSLFIGCEDVSHETEPLHFELETGLYQDENGYYHMELDMNEWQTLHRISGTVTRNKDYPVYAIKFDWIGDMSWLIGDTLGYIVENAYTAELVYVGYDTTHITWFEGHEVPIVNGASYSNEDGEVNTMIAPVRTMVGDTATIYYGFWDNWRNEATYDEFSIIFY